MSDPTAEEMREFLRSKYLAPSTHEFDIEEAIYWFASDYHGGQWTNLYKAIYASQYRPGPMTRGPEDVGKMMYEDLEEKFI